MAASAITLSTFIFARSNWFLIFLDLVLMVYLLSLLVSYTEKTKWTLAGIFVSPFKVLGSVIDTKSVFEIDKSSFKSIKLTSSSLQRIFVSTIITIFLLIIIVPLLASTNPIFEDFVIWFFSLINISEYLLDILVKLLRNLIVTATIYILITKTISLLLANTVITSYKIENPLKNYLAIPKVVVGIVLLAFFVSQIKLYNLSGNELALLGYSHSSYTREIFAQLSVVAAIIFSLLYNSNHHRISEKATNYFLILEGIFLTVIAQKSVVDYIEYWGFTIKRLYGLSGVIWLFAVFFIVLLYFALKKSRSFLVRGIFSITVALLLIINFANFDYIIYHYGKSTTHVGTDYSYLSDLSYDAEGHAELLDEVSNICFNETSTNNFGILYDLENLERKYQTLDIRTFNLSEYKTYKLIENKLNYYKTKPNPCLKADGEDLIINE